MPNSPEAGPPGRYFLPILKPELLETIDLVIEEKGYKTFLGEARETLEHANPELDSYMDQFSKKFRDPAYRILVRETAYLVHELLRQQAEADALDSQLD